MGLAHKAILRNHCMNEKKRYVSVLDRPVLVQFSDGNVRHLYDGTVKFFAIDTIPNKAHSSQSRSAGLIKEQTTFSLSALAEAVQETSGIPCY